MILYEEEERAGTAQETATPFTIGYCMATKFNTSGEENETSSDSKFQLQPINARTPEDFYCEESSAKLPLTDQEHQQIEEIIQRKQRWSFSLRVS